MILYTKYKRYWGLLFQTKFFEKFIFETYFMQPTGTILTILLEGLPIDSYGPIFNIFWIY